MPTDRKLDKKISTWLEAEAPGQLPDRVLRATFERTRKTRQQGRWRALLRRLQVNKFVPIGLGAAAVVVVLVVGAQLLGSPAAPGGAGAAPPPSAVQTPTPVGGSVQYQLDGAPATTKVDAVADGASVSGTAVTTFVGGTHTVRLECAAEYGDTWALGGTVEQSTAEPGSAGLWSAVIVKDGSPQQIGLWLSDVKSEGSDCDGWLASIDLADIGPENFQPVESGALVLPPDPAP